MNEYTWYCATLPFVALTLIGQKSVVCFFALFFFPLHSNFYICCLHLHNNSLFVPCLGWSLCVWFHIVSRRRPKKWRKNVFLVGQSGFSSAALVFVFVFVQNWPPVSEGLVGLADLRAVSLWHRQRLRPQLQQDNWTVSLQSNAHFLLWLFSN